MLTCRDVAESATEYMERKLSLRESLQVRLHLLICGLCRLYVSQLGTTRDLLRRLLRTAPSDDRMRTLLRAFRARTKDSEDDGR